MTSTNELLSIALRAAREAGDEIVRLYDTVAFDTKSDGSPVTIADTQAHNIILKHLNTTLIPVLSEESTGMPLPYPARLWIIDPLDGTRDFLNKTGDFSVMIGLLEEGRPTLGVVYAPLLDLLTYARRDEGAFMLHAGVTTQLQVASTVAHPLRFVCSVNNFTPYMEAVTEKLSAQKTPRGSIGIKASLLAQNKGDFFFSWGNFGEWDICAPQIIATESGLVVTDAHGDPIHYGTKENRVEHGILFSHPHCFTHVQEAIATTPHP